MNITVSSHKPSARGVGRITSIDRFKYLWVVILNTMSNYIGDIAEAKVISHLTEKGHKVSLPMYDAKFDLIVEIEKELYRVQVKSGRKRTERGSVSAWLLREGNVKYEYEDFDILAVYAAPLDRVAYRVWAEGTPKTKMEFRENYDGIEESHRHKANHIDDFTLPSAIDKLK